MAQPKVPVTELLGEHAKGKEDALANLWPAVQAELKRLAAHYLKGERPGHTLQPTALVNEAFLRFASLKEMQFTSRSHFFAMAATFMRRILINHARDRTRQKRGGDLVRCTFDVELVAGNRESEELLALNEALEKLEASEPRVAKVIELKCFGGLELTEIAEATGVSLATVKRDWTYGKAWLFNELKA